MERGRAEREAADRDFQMKLLQEKARLKGNQASNLSNSESLSAGARACPERVTELVQWSEELPSWTEVSSGRD